MKALGVIITLACIAGGGVAYVYYTQKPSLPAGAPEPDTFAACAIYYPVRESYPRTCTNGAGITLIEDIGNAAALRSQIVLDAPQPNSAISSPLYLKGRALGSWFDQSTLLVRIEDANGKEIGGGSVETKKYGGSADLLPFEGPVSFSAPVFGAEGSVVIENAGDSRSSLHIPIRFR